MVTQYSTDSLRSHSCIMNLRKKKKYPDKDLTTPVVQPESVVSDSRYFEFQDRMHSSYWNRWWNVNVYKSWFFFVKFVIDSQNGRKVLIISGLRTECQSVSFVIDQGHKVHLWYYSFKLLLDDKVPKRLPRNGLKTFWNPFGLSFLSFRITGWLAVVRVMSTMIHQKWFVSKVLL